MIEHIVLFKWKTEATHNQITSVLTHLRGMPDKIPDIMDISCGENFTNRAQGFTHGLVVRFRDRKALDSYQKHPIHQEIVEEQIKPILADILALDYEF
ncbi:MAG: Dabb family protein [Kamptonema sp. SIO4C4]|nr:Dabb family protein [Kamptonema sp. SIO4C4]